MSSCQYGCVHPPWAKPPSLSSSAPPGAWITPSNETNSETTILRMVISLSSAARHAVSVQSTVAPSVPAKGTNRWHQIVVRPCLRSTASQHRFFHFLQPLVGAHHLRHGLCW